MQVHLHTAGPIHARAVGISAVWISSSVQLRRLVGPRAQEHREVTGEIVARS